MHTENHKAGKKRVINSSKISTYDPRRAKEIRSTKSLAIKKKYQKLKSKLGDIKTYDLESLDTEVNPSKKERLAPNAEGGSDNAGKSTTKESLKANKKSRTKSKKEMFKKTRSGQPVMKYRIQKMLDVLQQ